MPKQSKEYIEKLEKKIYELKSPEWWCRDSAVCWSVSAYEEALYLYKETHDDS